MGFCCFFAHGPHAMCLRSPAAPSRPQGPGATPKTARLPAGANFRHPPLPAASDLPTKGCAFYGALPGGHGTAAGEGRFQYLCHRWASHLRPPTGDIPPTTSPRSSVSDLSVDEPRTTENRNRHHTTTDTLHGAMQVPSTVHPQLPSLPEEHSVRLCPSSAR